MKYFYLFALMMLPFFSACSKEDYILEDYNRDVIVIPPTDHQLLKDYYRGKKISIIGNSRCTFKDNIPSTNRSFYPKGDVDHISKTWWSMVINDIEATLEINNSFSAGRISNTHPTYPNYYSRIDNLGNPDVIFLWGGVNDQNNGISIGGIDFYLSDEDLDESYFAPALIKLIRKMRSLYSQAKIILFIEDNLGYDYVTGLFQIASYYNLQTIDFSNLAISKMDALHYDAKGMSQIASEAIRQLVKTIDR